MKSWKIIAEDIITDNIYYASRVSSDGCDGRIDVVVNGETRSVSGVGVLASEARAFLNETLVFEAFQRNILEEQNGIWAETAEEKDVISMLNSRHGLLLPLPTKYISSKYTWVDLDLISLSFKESVTLATYLRDKGLLNKLVACNEDLWRNPRKIGCVDEWNAILRSVSEYSTVYGNCSGLGATLQCRACDGDTLRMFLQFFILQLGFYCKFGINGDYQNYRISLSVFTYRRDLYYATMSLFYVTSAYVHLFNNAFYSDVEAKAREETVRNAICALRGFKSSTPAWFQILNLSKEEL